MRFLFMLVFLCGTLVLAAQTTRVEVAATGCKSMYLYAFNGAGFVQTASFAPAATGEWTLTKDFATPTFRYVGASAQDVLPVVLGGDEEIRIEGRCGSLRNATVAGSPINVQYQALKQTFQDHNRRFSTAMRAYNQSARSRDTTAMAAQRNILATLDAEKRALITATKAASPLLGRVVSLNTYLSYVAANRTEYANELDYFVDTYFQFVDFTDAGYDDLPWTYEGNRNFAGTLAQAVPGDRLGDILLEVYRQWPAGGQARLFALSGGFASLLQRKHPAAIRLADTLMAEYRESHPEPVRVIEQQAAGLRTFAIGAEAPDFAGPSPAGDTVRLSSLRGKVVLIDFWASWCGPCRRENPNVVRLYEQYRDKGFEILGVSLDQTKGRWEQAIAKDGLDWLHISDLKGWKSAYARQYGVSSIPHTVLLDAEGRILARNLRGGALAAKLGELFSGK